VPPERAGLRRLISKLVVGNLPDEDSARPRLLLEFPSALTVDKENLYGTWRLVSDVRQDVETGAMTDNFGKHPQGFLSYARDGRMSAIEVAEQRPQPPDLAKLSDEDRAALFRTMLAYAGTFSFDGKVVTHHVDISWNNNWTGTNQLRNARLEGDRLYITTNPQPSTIDGKLTVGILTWQKVE
jgi:hypothetical protein